jgi:hypothetical protein
MKDAALEVEKAASTEPVVDSDKLDMILYIINGVIVENNLLNESGQAKVTSDELCEHVYTGELLGESTANI